MVIVCPECSTKFHVNPERIPDAGTKVRCARCKHVFRAEKPAAEEAPISPITKVLEREEDNQRTETPETFAAGFDTPVTPEENEKPAAASDEPAFDYDQFREKDSSPQAEEEPFSFSSGTEELETPAAQPEEDEEESFSFGGLPEELADETPESSAVEEKPEELAATTEPAASDDELASAFTPAEEEIPAEPVIPPAVTEKPKKSAFASLLRILLLLVLAILIVGGVLLYMNGPEQLEQIFRQITGGQAGQQTEPGKIALDKLEGKFVNNQEAGELFVIRGEAINKFSEPRASIQVKGIIYDKDGQSLLQKTIFCGNPISDQELESLPFSKLEELMSNQFGKAMSNMNVNKDQSIPFIIVFRDLPQSLSEFSVDVTSSQPASE